MASIVSMMLIELKNHLTTKMISEISGPTKADIVKIGRFQDDPLKNNIYIAISRGDPDKTDWRDGIVTLESMEEIGFSIEPREIGGGEVWWRRGVVQIGCYFVKEKYSEEEAIIYAETVMSRLVYSIRSAPLTGLVDEFGERSVLHFVYGHQFNESGGPPTSYIWRGKVWFQCLTEQN